MKGKHSAGTARRGRGAAPGRPDTRARLLETAGRVFAEKGFEGATGKEICRLARANAAAVVYHFGSMEELYAAVLVEARNRLVTTDMLIAAVSAERDPRLKLQSLIGVIVRTLAGPASQSWAARVIGREITSTSQAADTFVDRELQARAAILKGLVSELTGLPVEHPVVARGAVSIIGPCLLLLIVNRRRFERAFPAYDIHPGTIEEVTQDLTRFTLAGLGALARGTRASASGP